ncbi:nucleotidyl transferase AbiEii/AbiGii toxin family protein [Candidatus Desantisbacteria bacterium]|nr:nucleotidyl transferase AbiEii/AbiGii toxin family protein [Candidatus Desantisbacteria bacterium]
MLYKAISPSLAGILKEINTFQLPQGTYLAGGTALAIYLNHRISVDIDLFTENEFYNQPILSILSQKFKTVVTNAYEKNTLIAEIDNIKFSLFKYPYPLLEPLFYVSDFNIYLASIIDIAAMKIVAIGQRGTAKDFVDLKAIISTRNFSLEYLIMQVQKKYKVSEEYNYQIKKSLVFFDDAKKSLGEVTLFENNEFNRIKIEEWEKTEKFFKKLIFNK